MAASATAPRDWKIALMQRVLFGTQCPLEKCSFSEYLMMDRIQRIADIAKSMGKWPEIIPGKKRYEEEVLGHVKTLLKKLAICQKGYTSTVKEIDVIQNDESFVDPKQLIQLRKIRFKWEEAIFTKWKGLIFGKEKIIDPKGKLEREIALLAKWEELLTTAQAFIQANT
jgi:hypothetical protein